MRKNFNKIYVLDTNIILSDASNMSTLSEGGDNLIILPETTIDELDLKKSGFDEINFQAREFGRILADSKVVDTHKVGKTKNITIMEVELKNNMIVHIISFKDYELDGVDKTIINDRKIIKVASFATSYYKNKENTFLISSDIMCRTRAISLNVQSVGLAENKKDRELEFIKELPLSSIYFNGLDGKDILEIDPGYLSENFCYKFLSEDGNVLYAYILNERINPISDDLFKGCLIKPLNEGQRFAMAGILDNRIDISYLNAIAGSGKTLLALAAGMRCLDKKQYDKILYIRNSIESLDKGEDVGYLAGNDEKFRIYNFPLFDSLDFLARKSLKKSENRESQDTIESKIAEMTSKYQIECLWVGALRGRSLDNAYVLLDEFQNISQKTMQTILTRLGKNCKVVLAGSSNQIDNLYINKHTNADAVIVEALKQKQDLINVFATKLSKVVRGAITEWAEKLFTK